MSDGSILTSDPKIDAGRRTISIPPPLIPELEAHLEEFADPGPTGYLFRGVKGGPLREHVWQKKWDEARRRVGLEDLHFHDRRHVANTMAAATGASLRELVSHGARIARRRTALSARHRAARQSHRPGPRRPHRVIAGDRAAALGGEPAAVALTVGPFLCGPFVARWRRPSLTSELARPLTRTLAGAGDGNRTRVLSLGS